MRRFAKGFWMTFGILFAVLIIGGICLCIVQAIRLAGTTGMTYADMWHNWSAFFPKKETVEAVAHAVLKI